MLSIFTTGPVRVDITERGSGSGLPIGLLVGAGAIGAVGYGLVWFVTRPAVVITTEVLLIIGVPATIALAVFVAVASVRIAIDSRRKRPAAACLPLRAAEPARTALPATARVIALPAGRSVSEPRVRVRVRPEGETRN